MEKNWIERDKNFEQVHLQNYQKKVQNTDDKLQAAVYVKDDDSDEADLAEGYQQPT